LRINYISCRPRLCYASRSFCRLLPWFLPVFFHRPGKNTFCHGKNPTLPKWFTFIHRVYRAYYLTQVQSLIIDNWRRRGSVVRKSVFGWQTFSDLRLTCDHRYGSTNQANSAFHPFGVGKCVVHHVITWITGVETIKRQTWATYCCSSRVKVPWTRA